MPSDADYACMAYARGNRDPDVVAAVEQEIASEEFDSQLGAVRRRLQAIGDRMQQHFRIGRLYDHEASPLDAATRHPIGFVWTRIEPSALERPKYAELARLLADCRALENKYGSNVVCEVKPNYNW